ncbi:response regulator [Hymenobacter setariae]|uniref:Response regulator n=1 Tax=Hymenobacter setariae TaxID=2594794 RepID=A0A558C1F9_9BACT|nr:response regulator [Hymenobacter setariae]TVT42542.1 response regulator [Hymenobacter setariae]
MPKLASVLLVDDDATTNFLNKLLLQTMGVAEQLLVAENGMEALRILHQTCGREVAETCPQLILLDMNMPIMNGLAFLETYTQQAQAHHHSPVIVMLTTSLHERDLARAQALPIASFLNKPLTREKVTAILEEYFA